MFGRYWRNLRVGGCTEIFLRVFIESNRFVYRSQITRDTRMVLFSVLFQMIFLSLLQESVWRPSTEKICFDVFFH